MGMEAVALSLVKSAGQQLGKWMVEEAKYLYEVKDKVEGLQNELEWIQCFLRNTDDKQRDDEMVRKWISEINDFSYDAVDILEKYLLKVSHPRDDGIWKLLKWTACVVSDAMSTHEVGADIDVLTNKISKLASRMVTYGIKPQKSGKASSSYAAEKKAEFRRTHSHLPVDDIVGLEKNTNVLVNKLMNKETNVIFINGMAGSGKTTLARKVYQTVKGHHFEMCAWIYVSQKFQTREVIRRILLRLFADDQSKRQEILTSEEQLERKLYTVLQEKKCLVVLDDIWKVGDWNCLKIALPISNCRSKLMITTRNMELRLHIDPLGFSHEPALLNSKESMQLFNKKAFHGKDTRDPKTRQLFMDMKTLAEKIVAQCKGLPLAIVVLGGLLATKTTLDEWKSVHKNFQTIISSKNDEDIGVSDVLELSYIDLPYHLRPCLLHLASFPEDFEIPTKKLYHMWIAEGIVAQRNDNPENLENIANSYLRELVQRCIVQAVKLGPTGKIKTCRLHDLTLEMCTHKAEEENFLSVIRQENAIAGYKNYTAVKVRRLHRLAIHFGHSLQHTFPSHFNKASHLRSLMFFSSGPVNNAEQGWLKAIISNFLLLRLLDLEHTGVQKIPKEVGTLIHLRYLSIMGTRVRKLSSSIGNLRCLQTLDLRVCLPERCVMRIPNVLRRMKALSHLYLPSHAYKVKRSRSLRINGLNNIEVLKNFDPRISRVADLCKLENLRKLSIKNEVSKTKTLKIIMESLSIKNHVLARMSLKIRSSILNEEATILSNCSFLHTLEIGGTISKMKELRLENAVFPENLTILTIKNCKLLCVDPMQKFKQLPNLRSLTLDTVSFDGNCMDCSDEGFLQLVHLKLSNINTLQEWRVGEEALRNLHHLQIYNCNHKQLMIPEGLPISVEVVCNPCVKGTEKYFSCPYLQIELVDDDDDDLATRHINNYFC